MSLLHNLRVHTYLVIQNNSVLLLKVIYMKTELQDLERRQAHLQTMRDVCRDAIEQLKGFPPDGCAFTFFIREVPTVSFPLSEQDQDFCLSFFISWYQYYSRQLRDIEGRLKFLTASEKAGL